jgi:regulatory protein
MQKEMTNKKAISKEAALSRLAALCARSEQCIQSCMEKLSRWGVSADDSATIIQHLVAEKYIDERRYATLFTKDKHRLAHWGKNKIANTLKLSKIPSAYINEALAQISDESYETQLTDLVMKKLKSCKAKNSYDLKAKLYRFAISRGFESNLALSAIEDILKNNIINYTEQDETFND